MEEQYNFPWFCVNGFDDNGKPKNGRKIYYIPEPTKALDVGYFKLQDTKEIFKVTGIKKNIQPMCLEFEKTNDWPEVDIPIAKNVCNKEGETNEHPW